MKYRFLCAPHRQQISQNPSKAIQAFYSSFETAQSLCDIKQYQDALPYAGNAFEIAEIILTTQAAEPRQACEFFSCSAILFANSCSELGYDAQCLEIFWMTIHRLEKEISHGQKRQSWLHRHLGFFYESIQLADFTWKEADLASIFRFYEPACTTH